MKRILAITLTLVMLLAALTGCMASKNPSGSEGEQPKQAQCLSEENGVYKLTLPKSKEVIELYEEQERFVLACSRRTAYGCSSGGCRIG